MFQQQVFINQGFGVPGELWSDAPHRAFTYVLDSDVPTNNVFGRAFCLKQNSDVPLSIQVGQPGTRPYVGILVDPKSHVSFGSGGNPLAPSLSLPNGTSAQCLTMGQIVVALATNCLAGDEVIFENATGILSALAPGSALPPGHSLAYANVMYPNSVGSNRLTVISVNVPANVPTIGNVG